MRVHCRAEVEEPYRSELCAAIRGLTFGADVPRPVDVLVAGVPSEEEVAAIAAGGALVVPYAGLARATRERLLARPDIAVYNLHHNAAVVAEHAVGMLLAVARRLVPAHVAMARGDWRMRYEPDDSPSLSGRRAVILGYGAIGRRVGRALEALGMEVVGIRRRVAPTLDDLDTWLPGAAALIVALPHTPRTEGLVDAAMLARLPADAIVVNVGRGPVVDEEALVRALVERRIFGAGIDAWWRYPEGEEARASTFAEHPLHELDNVLLSPHRAAHGAATDRLRYAHLAEVLAELVAGRTPASRVSPDEGY